MKWTLRTGLGSLAAASTLAMAFGGAGAASATAAHHAARPSPAVTACSVASRNGGLPKTATLYSAGSAGSVRIATLNSGTIRVISVSAATGYRASVDSASGSSVDVYFRHGTHTVKFEAEINDAGGLTTRVTTC